MSEPYGMHVRFTAKTGEADALEGVLLQAAEDARADENCLLYVVSRSPDAPDVVLVTEAWTDRAAHDASLEDPATRALICIR